MTTLCNVYNRVTAYTIKEDALKTGELDYINGGKYTVKQHFDNFLWLLPFLHFPASLTVYKLYW